jgi:multidrug resistance efflux pump
MAVENNNIQLRSEEVQEILSAVPNWMIRWGNTLILLLLFLFLLLSWFIKYPDVVQAQAVVTTIIPPEKITAKSTGKFDAFLTKDGDTIYANQPLAILENTANYKDVLFLKNTCDTIKINTKNFNFPIATMPLLFLGEVESAYALFESNYTDLLLYKKLQPYTTEFSAGKTSLNETRRRLQIQQAQQNTYKKELAYKRTNLARNRTLFDKGVLSKQEMEQKELEFLREERAYQNLQSGISSMREQISNANKSFKGNEIRKIQEENKRIKQVVQSYNQLKKALKDWELRYVLKASLTGKVSLLNIYDKNQRVQAGELVFTIIPLENKGYVAKLKAPLQNSGKLKIGQKVSIQLANYPSQEYGKLKGKVKSISAISDKDKNYLIDVMLPNNLNTSYNKKLVFKQEMQGNAEIVTEDLRLIERFFYRIRSVLDQ